MLSKRDLQLVRLAVRWKWFSPEQGEDLLFLKRKFGGKLSVEEIIRRRRYLRDDELEVLSQKTDEVLGTRRGRPRPQQRGRTVYERSPELVKSEPAKPSAWDRVPTRSIESLEEITDPSQQRSIHEEDTEGPRGKAKKVDRPAIARPELEAFESEGGVLDGAMTIVAPMSDALKTAIAEAKRKHDERETEPPEGDVERTAIASIEQIEELRRRLKEHQAASEETDEQDADELKRQVRSVQKEAIKSADQARTLAGTPAVRAEHVPSRARARDDSALRARAERETIQDGVPDQTLADQPVYFDRPPKGEGAIQRPIVTDIPPHSTGAVPEVGFEEDSAPTVAPFDEDDLEGDLEDRDLLSGDFGPYFIERSIARGRRGVMYLAEAPDGSVIALKVFSDDAGAKRALARFQKLAPKIATIDSPNVVKIIDYGTIDERPFVAMQYVDAWTLEERLDSGDRPDLIEALSIVRDVGRGLIAGQAQGVIHCDINPDNILIGRNGEVLIAGFGLPKEVDGVKAENGGTVFGSVGYLAPEQALGTAVDHRTDLFSLGATLFHLVTGRKAIEAPDTKSLLHRLTAEPIESVRTVDPTVPEVVAAVVAKLVAIRPEDRFQNTAELIDALGRAIAEVRAQGLPSAGEALSRTKRVLLMKATAVTLAAVFTTVVIPLSLRALSVLSYSSELALQGAFFGALGLFVGLTLIFGLGLVRRGELPLPMSSAWLVSVQDGAGAAGASLLVAGLALGPGAILNVLISAIASVVLGSWIYGILLRRTIAFLRPDKGVGRVLAVLGDPNLSRWRLVHVPLLTTLTGLATMRLAFLAYFAASKSVLS